MAKTTKNIMPIRTIMEAYSYFLLFRKFIIPKALEFRCFIHQLLNKTDKVYLIDYQQHMNLITAESRLNFHFYWKVSSLHFVLPILFQKKMTSFYLSTFHFCQLSSSILIVETCKCLGLTPTVE